MSELLKDGVRLWYTEAGAGTPHMLFAHGWCCDHTYFQPQFEYFQSNHRVVVVDLRGHGQSDKPVQDYTVDGFASDLLWIADQLEMNSVVIIGHSLGGLAALQAAAIAPDIVAGAVLVDPAPVIQPDGLSRLATPFLKQLRSPQYQQAARQHVENVLFIPSDDPELRARVSEAICSTPQHVMASAMEQIFAWNGEVAASACAVPVLNISAAFPIGDLAKFQELCPQLVTGQTVGAGHFNQLLAPEQVNNMIERFLLTSSVRTPLGSESREASSPRTGPPRSSAGA
ncbi:MAG: alpha/beta hydrolase fold protein [Acidimicrobiaceae bacterium]|nr:alpha/beta hydrolase fold protein [Acidimicrobiaceae bacterium]